MNMICECRVTAFLRGAHTTEGVGDNLPRVKHFQTKLSDFGLYFSIFTDSGDYREHDDIRCFLRELRSSKYHIVELLHLLLMCEHAGFIERKDMSVTSERIAITWEALQAAMEFDEDVDIRPHAIKNSGDE